MDSKSMELNLLTDREPVDKILEPIKNNDDILDQYSDSDHEDDFQHVGTHDFHKNEELPELASDDAFKDVYEFVTKIQKEPIMMQEPLIPEPVKMLEPIREIMQEVEEEQQMLGDLNDFDVSFDENQDDMKSVTLNFINSERDFSDSIKNNNDILDHYLDSDHDDEFKHAETQDFETNDELLELSSKDVHKFDTKIQKEPLMMLEHLIPEPVKMPEPIKEIIQIVKVEPKILGDLNDVGANFVEKQDEMKSVTLNFMKSEHVLFKPIKNNDDILHHYLGSAHEFKHDELPELSSKDVHEFDAKIEKEPLMMQEPLIPEHVKIPESVMEIIQEVEEEPKILGDLNDFDVNFDEKQGDMKSTPIDCMQSEHDYVELNKNNDHILDYYLDCDNDNEFKQAETHDFQKNDELPKLSSKDLHEFVTKTEKEPLIMQELLIPEPVKMPESVMEIIQEVEEKPEMLDDLNDFHANFDEKQDDMKSPILNFLKSGPNLPELIKNNDDILDSYSDSDNEDDFEYAEMHDFYKNDEITDLSSKKEPLMMLEPLIPEPVKMLEPVMEIIHEVEEKPEMLDDHNDYDANFDEKQDDIKLVALNFTESDRNLSEPIKNNDDILDDYSDSDHEDEFEYAETHDFHKNDELPGQSSRNVHEFDAKIEKEPHIMQEPLIPEAIEIPDPIREVLREVKEEPEMFDDLNDFDVNFEEKQDEMKSATLDVIEPEHDYLESIKNNDDVLDLYLNSDHEVKHGETQDIQKNDELPELSSKAMHEFDAEIEKKPFMQEPLILEPVNMSEPIMEVIQEVEEESKMFGDINDFDVNFDEKQDDMKLVTLNIMKSECELPEPIKNNDDMDYYLGSDHEDEFQHAESYDFEKNNELQELSPKDVHEFDAKREKEPLMMQKPLIPESVKVHEPVRELLQKIREERNIIDDLNDFVVNFGEQQDVMKSVTLDFIESECDSPESIKTNDDILDDSSDSDYEDDFKYAETHDFDKNDEFPELSSKDTFEDVHEFGSKIEKEPPMMQEPLMPEPVTLSGPIREIIQEAKEELNIIDDLNDFDTIFDENQDMKSAALNIMNNDDMLDYYSDSDYEYDLKHAEMHDLHKDDEFPELSPKDTFKYVHEFDVKVEKEPLMMQKPLIPEFVKMPETVREIVHVVKDEPTILHDLNIFDEKHELGRNFPEPIKYQNDIWEHCSDSEDEYDFKHAETHDFSKNDELQELSSKDTFEDVLEFDTIIEKEPPRVQEYVIPEPAKMPERVRKIIQGAKAKPAKEGIKKIKLTKMVVRQPYPAKDIIEIEAMFYKSRRLDSWFHPDWLNPVEENLIYWKNLKNSGAVFGAVLLILLSLLFFSLISVMAYVSLLSVAAAIIFRICKDIIHAVRKTGDGHPFKKYLETDIRLSQEKVEKVSKMAVDHINDGLIEMRRLFLVEDLVDSIKFAFRLWCFTHLGAWFNVMTLIILAWIALFSIPIIYEKNKRQIYAKLDSVRFKVAKISFKVKGVFTFGKKGKKKE